MPDTLDHIRAAFDAAKRFESFSPSGRARLRARIAALSCLVLNDPPLHAAIVRLQKHLQVRHEVLERRYAPGRMWARYDRESGRWEDWQRRHFWSEWRRIRREASAAEEWETVVSLDALRSAIIRHEGIKVAGEAAAHKARIQARAAALDLGQSRPPNPAGRSATPAFAGASAESNMDRIRELAAALSLK